MIVEHADEMFPNNSHMLADSAFKLTEKMLVPYKNNGHLSQIQKRYNRRHASARSVIERAFGFLTGRFRRLRDLQCKKMENYSKIIMACCILHNVCLNIYEDNDEEVDAAFEELDEMDEDIEEPLEEFDNVPNAATIKRDAIANNLEN